MKDGKACSEVEILALLDRISDFGHCEPGNLQVVGRSINRWKGAKGNTLFVRLLREFAKGAHGRCSKGNVVRPSSSSAFGRECELAGMETTAQGGSYIYVG